MLASSVDYRHIPRLKYLTTIDRSKPSPASEYLGCASCCARTALDKRASLEIRSAILVSYTSLASLITILFLISRNVAITVWRNAPECKVTEIWVPSASPDVKKERFGLIEELQCAVIFRLVDSVILRVFPTSLPASTSTSHNASGQSGVIQRRAKTATNG